MRAGRFLQAGFLLAVILSSPACMVKGNPAGDPLDGTSWTLVAYRKTAPIPSTSITASFEDGQIKGSSGCNSYAGSYKTEGDKIEIGELAWTLMACIEPEGIMDRERLVMESLGDASRYRLADGRLQIFRSDGEALTFIPHG